MRENGAKLTAARDRFWPKGVALASIGRTGISMQNVATKRLILLWAGFAAYLAIFAIALTVEPSTSDYGRRAGLAVLALGIPASLAYFTLIRATLQAYGFSWLRLAVLLFVPIAPFVFLAIATWKKFEATR